MPAKPAPPRRRNGQSTTIVHTQPLRRGRPDGPPVTDIHTNLSEGVFTEAPAHVTFGLRATKNLGDFQSLQVTVSLTRPCRDTQEDIDRTEAEASAWVHSKVQRELAAVAE